MKPHATKIVAACMVLLSLPLFARDEQEAFATKKSMGGLIELSFRDAYRINVDIDTPQIDPAMHLRVSHDELFTIFGRSVVHSQKTDGDWNLRTTYEAESDVLAIAHASVERQLLVLTRTNLQIVDFSGRSARVLGSFPIDNRRAMATGHFVERLGDSVFVVDHSLPGLRHLSMARPESVVEVATFASITSPTELRLRGDAVYVVAATEVISLPLAKFAAPQHVVQAHDQIRSIAFDSDGRMYVADGLNLRILRSGSEEESSLWMPKEIQRVEIHDDRAFVFDDSRALEVVAMQPSAR